jgi:hypothetical protein
LLRSRFCLGFCLGFAFGPRAWLLGCAFGLLPGCAIGWITSAHGERSLFFGCASGAPFFMGFSTFLFVILFHILIIWYICGGCTSLRSC